MKFNFIVDEKTRILFNRIKNENYIGFDPYDGLNSKILKQSCLYQFPIIRLIWLQFFKHCPINFRRLFLVSTSFNPKAGALLILGLVKLHRLGKNNYQEECYYLFDCLKEKVLRRKNCVGWGYNFDWQAKAFYVAEGTPNIVTSVYVGNALMDFYAAFGEEEARVLASGVGQFILSEMILWEKEHELCFSYIPGKDAEVHNANLMAAAFLSRINEYSQDGEISEKIKKSVEFSLKDIGKDGYWPYGTKPHHRWMDNFHTAFNLEALLLIKKNLKTQEYDPVIRKVFQFYLKNMFSENGVPKYYKNKLYPIDIHTIAESIIFLSKVISYEGEVFNAAERKKAKILADCIAQFAFNNMWDPKGFFYYQKNRWLTNKIPYMRWAQAWMFYALSCYLKELGDENSVQ